VGRALGYRRSATRTRRTLRIEFDYDQVTLQLSETTCLFVDDHHNAITLDSSTIFSVWKRRSNASNIAVDLRKSSICAELQPGRRTRSASQIGTLRTGSATPPSAVAATTPVAVA
jgi:hypothetical protein